MTPLLNSSEPEPPLSELLDPEQGLDPCSDPLSSDTPGSYLFLQRESLDSPDCDPCLTKPLALSTKPYFIFGQNTAVCTDSLVEGVGYIEFLNPSLSLKMGGG